MNIPADGKTMKAVLIAGPTASGKSALALDLAIKLNGAIINADSMQVYDTLHVLTARPSEDDMRRVSHFLYGHVPAAMSYSVGDWSRDVEALLGGPDLRGKVPVFVGGTGLYFKALLGGLSAMPVIPDPVRDHWRQRLSEEGPQALHAALRDRDPQVAGQLNTGDSHRIVRALEVFEASGRSIREFQQISGKQLIDPDAVRKIVFRPDRTVLHERIRKRFDRMMQSGAVEEVRALLSQDLVPGASVMKAIGVREITAFINGDLSVEEVVEKATIATRQYAKRQRTWFRNQFDDDWEIAG
jgi:tRNA dimethylallyltransferase